MSVEVFWWSGFFIALGGGALAAWALFIRGQPKGRLRCPTCWYDMAGAVADAAGAHTCPECGRRIVKPTQLCRTRRFWRLAVFGLSLVIAGAGLWATPMLRAEKWQRHAPSTLLVMLADTDEVDPISETRRELFIRAAYGQLGERHRTVLSERLAKHVSPDGVSLVALELIDRLRPGRSQALAQRMSMIIAAWGKRHERSLDDDELQWSDAAREGFAIEILGRAGSEEAVETLSASLSSPWEPNRDLAAIALGRIGGDAAIDSLTEMVADGSEQVALAAAVALVMIGEPAREHAEAAIAWRLTRTGLAEQRAVLAACLSVLRGEEAHISIPLMRLFIEGRMGVELMEWEFVVGDQFIRLLREDAMPSLPLVMSYLDDEDPARVERALMAIDILGPGAAEALPVLDEMAAKPGANQLVTDAIAGLRRPD